MTTLRIPTPLRPYTEGQGELQVSAPTVGEAMRELVSRYPALRPHLFTEQDDLRSFVNLFVNDEDIRSLDGAGTPLSDGDRLMIIPSIAGG
ncbi:MAG: ubiquitin-like small modifier protein 1 [Chloroflexota bacterium]